MSYAIVGSNGNFSRQLQELVKNEKFTTINKNIYSEWHKSNSQLVSTLESAIQEFNCKFLINTVGIVSKNSSVENTQYWNFSFPLHLYQICQDLNLIFVTLGSIHENITGMCTSNPYLESKKSLEQLLSKNSFNNSIHFQFHTWYGGRQVHSEMFLGQIINSIKNKTIFNMSDGEQIREYHHIEDDVKCALSVLRHENVGSYAINHGESFSLKEIACSIFSFFDCDNLLKLNQVSPPKFEIRERNILQLHISDCEFRPTMEGLIDYVKENI